MGLDRQYELTFDRSHSSEKQVACLFSHCKDNNRSCEMNFISYVIKLDFHTSRLKLVHFSIVLSVFFSHVQQNEYAYHSKDRFLVAIIFLMSGKCRVEFYLCCLEREPTMSAKLHTPAISRNLITNVFSKRFPPSFLEVYHLPSFFSCLTKVLKYCVHGK